jgi:site-specific DNA-cytosine methylase
LRIIGLIIFYKEVSGVRIAVLFDGAGLARLGLEQAGHDCTGYELDPYKHRLSQFIGSGNSTLADVRKVDLSGYDAVWASPPCQKRSQANNNLTTSQKEVQEVIYLGYDELLQFSLNLPHEVLWVENVIEKQGDNTWGNYYNAAQFQENPIQLRNRIIGGRFIEPKVYRPYKRYYKDLKICPAIMACQGQGGYSPKFKRAEGFYGRKMTLDECAYHMGFEIPKEWYDKPNGVSDYEWKRILFEAIGNGVPAYMSRAFGEVYRKRLSTKNIHSGNKFYSKLFCFKEVKLS